MKKSDATSSDTTSSTGTASSKGSSELDLERDIPTTEEDVKALREIRRWEPGVNLLPYIDELLNPRQFENIPPRRTTSEGWPELVLD